jgi:hypothetical protein
MCSYFFSSYYFCIQKGEQNPFAINHVPLNASLLGLIFLNTVIKQLNLHVLLATWIKNKQLKNIIETYYLLGCIECPSFCFVPIYCVTHKQNSVISMETSIRGTNLYFNS